MLIKPPQPPKILKFPRKGPKFRGMFRNFEIAQNSEKTFRNDPSQPRTEAQNPFYVHSAFLLLLRMADRDPLSPSQIDGASLADPVSPSTVN
jgi:hypothetical protein